MLSQMPGQRVVSFDMRLAQGIDRSSDQGVLPLFYLRLPEHPGNRAPFGRHAVNLHDVAVCKCC